MSGKTRIYVSGVIAAAGVLFIASLATWSPANWSSVALYVALAMLASLVKLRLPGLDGTYSLNFAFLLFGIIHFPLPQTLIAGCASALVQSYWHARHRPTTIQILFN